LALAARAGAALKWIMLGAPSGRNVVAGNRRSRWVVAMVALGMLAALGGRAGAQRGDGSGGWPPDAFEPNETLETAVVIQPGTYSGNISGDPDRDYFAVDLIGGDALLVFLEFEQDEGDLDLRILNDLGTPLTSGITSTDNEQVFWRGAEGERYFVRVNGYLGAANDYVITFWALPNGGVPLEDDFLEENDVAEVASAGSLAVSKTRLSLLDEDWFRLDLQEHDSVTASLDFIHRIGDIDVGLVNAEGREVAAATSGSDDELLIAEFLPAGAYWLRVYGYEEAKNFYDLTIAVEPARGPALIRPTRPAQEAFPAGGGPRASQAFFGAPDALDPLPRSARRTLPQEKRPDEIIPGEFLVRWESADALKAFQAVARTDASGVMGETRLLNRSLDAEASASFGDIASSHRQPWTLLRRDDPALREGNPWRRVRGQMDDDAMKAIRSLPGVAAVEPNRWTALADAYYPPEQNLAQAPYLQIAGLPEMWARSMGEGVVVAVIDTGARLDHPELAPNIWRNEREATGAPGVDDDGNGYLDDAQGWDFVSTNPDFAAEHEDLGPPDADPTDRQGHGTAVAGVVAAAEGNPDVLDDPEGSNMVGAAPRAKIMVLRAGFATSSGSGLLNMADWIEAIYYAADNGAQIINMSFATHVASEAAEAAVNHARRRGCLLVAAAGNEGFYYPRYPAAFEGVVAAGSVNVQLKKSGFSNFGVWVDAMSFGENILVPWHEGGYERGTGTSFASPMTAGLAANLMSGWGLSAAETEARLRLSAQDIVPLNHPYQSHELGWGLLRVDLARETLEQEDRGEIVRFLVENAGGAPGSTYPGNPPPAFAPGKVFFGSDTRPLPGERRLVEFRTIRALEALAGRVWAFALTPETTDAPETLAFLKALPPDPQPFAEDFADATAAGWEGVAFEPSPLAPFEQGEARVEGGSLRLETAGPSRLAMAQGPEFEALGPGSFLMAEFDMGAASLGPGTAARFRLHSGNWSAMTSAWVRFPDGALRNGENVFRLLLPEGPGTLASGLRGGVDLLAGPESANQAFLEVDAFRVRTVPFPPMGAGARIDFEAVPSLAEGWLASAPEGLAPVQIADAAGLSGGGAGVRIALGGGETPAAGFIETPSLTLEPGRLYRARFVLRGEGVADWRQRPAAMLYAYRTDGTASAARLFENPPVAASERLSESAAAFDLFFRSAPDGLPGNGAIRLGAGLARMAPAGAEKAALAESFLLTSIVDPWSEPSL
jgi:subtilisin family serine protease